MLHRGQVHILSGHSLSCTHYCASSARNTNTYQQLLAKIFTSNHYTTRTGSSLSSPYPRNNTTQMTDSTQYNFAFNLFQDNVSDEPYFAAGTHRLPQTSNTIPTTRQIEQEIDEIQSTSNNNTHSLGDPIDLSSIELALDFGSWMSLDEPTQAPFQDNQEDFVPTAPRRVDSDLRATAKEFVPQQQWQTQQLGWTPDNGTTLMAQPRNRDRMSHMTPLQTNVNSLYHTPPMSAPSRPTIYQQSPMISLNDEGCLTSIPQGNLGYQWPFATPPSMDINTWAQGTRDFVDPNRLTPITPVTPVYGGSLERTGSRTSRTSRTTAGPYICEHENCVGNGKEFRSKTEYSHHRRNHGERQHACTQCNKRFVFRKDLTRHYRVHTDQREYFGPVVEDCQWCAKGFQRKDHYERHMRTHTQKGEAVTPAPSSAALSRTHSRS